jgi:hypothetical protein
VHALSDGDGRIFLARGEDQELVSAMADEEVGLAGLRPKDVGDGAKPAGGRRPVSVPDGERGALQHLVA